MKTITLVQAIDLLSDCIAVIVDGGYVTYPNLVEEGDEDVAGEWLYLTPNEDGPRERFAEQTNQNISISPMGELILRNTKGQETWVMLLKAAPIAV